MSKRLAQISIAVGGIATAAVLFLTSQFFFVPRGTTIFPLGWMVQTMLVAGFAFFFGVFPAIYAFRIPPRRRAVIGLALSLLPAPLALFCRDCHLRIQTWRMTRHPDPWVAGP